MLRSALLILLVSLSSVGLQACGSDSTGPKDENYAGTYNLETVEGQSLPAVIIQVGNDKLEITGGSIRLNDDQTFSTTLSYRLTEDGSVSTETERQTGTFVKNSNALRFNYSDGTQDTGSLNGNVLTFTSEGVTAVFRK